MTSGDEGTTVVEGILRRAGTEVGAGRPWRAREILQGALRGHATDPRILEAYGRVLDGLGDLTAQFPRGIRNAGLDALPPVVRAVLAVVGLVTIARWIF